MTIHWEESVPSNASFVGNAPQDFRSVWTAMATGLSVEHFWPGSGGESDASAGELRLGASRAFSAPKSRSSTPANAIGRLFLDQTNSRLYAYESGSTYLVGTSWFEDNATDSGSSGYWVRTAGAVASVPTGSSSTVVAFPLTYVAAPTVFVIGSNSSWVFTVGGSTTTNFTSLFSSFAGAASTATFQWEAFGLLSGVSY